MKLKVFAFGVIFILVTVTVFCLGYYKRAQAQACGPQVVCGSPDPYCSDWGITSLPAVNVHAAGDWYVEDITGNCGVKYCFPIGPFQCACGQPRGGRLCTTREKNEL
jgi:hypothetical protein